MGHLGLTPQKIRQLGGFKPQARTAAAAQFLTEDALALQDAGVFSLVLESVPQEVALHVSQELEIPTIGIGAGPHCDGQVLVWHDLLGLDDTFVPPFAKTYRSVGKMIVEGLADYRREVKDGLFPAAPQTRSMEPQELDEFQQKVRAC